MIEFLRNLDYLSHRTKSDPKLMLEMISLYLGQTTSLISVMKQTVENADWSKLKAVVHKMIPSFVIMGIDTNYENLAIKIREHTIAQEFDHIPSLVNELEKVLGLVCNELEQEYKRIKTANP